MAQSTESRAVFLERLTSLGLAEFVENFRARGWDSFGSFAFAVASPPGTNPEIFDAEVLVPILGDEAGQHVLAAQVRRLHWEAFTLAASELKRRVERTGDEPPRRLPDAERHVRRQRLEARLTGLRLEGYGDPSHALIDLFVDAFEANQLSYIPWAACTPRSAEIALKVKKKSWAPDSAGIVKERSEDIQPTVDVSATLELDHALLRRGLAAEMGGVLSFEGNEKIRRRFLESLLDDVPDARYQRPSLEQIRKADVWMFQRLAKLTRGGIRPGADGVLPLEAAVDEALASPELAVILMPLPATAAKAAQKPDASTDEHLDGPTKRQRRREAARARAKCKAEAARRAEQEKGKQTDTTPPGKARRVNMPAALVGLDGARADGQRRCYAFNLGDCKLLVKAGRCDKGHHECMKCGAKDHGAHQCPR